MLKVEDMLIFIGKFERVHVESILVSLLGCKRELFEKMQILCFMMLDDIPDWQFLHQAIILDRPNLRWMLPHLKNNEYN